MDRLNKILVIFDDDHETQTAMLRAIELARKTDASIHVIATYYTNLSFIEGELVVETESLLREGIQARMNRELSDYIDTLNAAGIEISYESLWAAKPQDEICKLCTKEPFDLLIKTANKHHRFEGIFHTPLDWHLLRDCPCPVLLVSEEEWPKGDSIIAAIDANSSDEAHQKLNNDLLKTARCFGNLFNNQVYAVNACPPIPILIDLEYTSIDPETYLHKLKHTAFVNTLEISAPYKFKEDDIKIVKGDPEKAIPKLADNLGSRLIVLGTVSRKGLQGYILGNTAEKLLHNLHCDVLALKPQPTEES